MGWFKKQTTDPEELERLKTEIALMSARLSAADEQKQQLGEQVRGLVARLDTPIAPPPTEPPPVAPTVDPAEIDMLNAKIERLATKIDGIASSPPTPVVDPEQTERVEQLDDRVGRVTARLDEIDQRITSISTELANQLSELSTELEAIGAREPLDGETVEGLRVAQTKLAEEQARYQIAFRRDLAELADRLRQAAADDDDDDDDETDD